MSELNLSSTSVMNVIRSWETARQRNGFDEQLGIDTLLFLFQMDPQIKQIFGFPVDKEVKAEGMQRMGILIHGLRIIKMLDLLFSVLGPDTDILSQVLADMGEQHCKLGLSPDHFTLLCRALLEVLEKIMGEDGWNADLRRDWFQVIRALSVEIAKCMQKRMSKVCLKLTLEDMKGGEVSNPSRAGSSLRRASSGDSLHSSMRSTHSTMSLSSSSSSSRRGLRPPSSRGDESRRSPHRRTNNNQSNNQNPVVLESKMETKPLTTDGNGMNLKNVLFRVRKL